MWPRVADRGRTETGRYNSPVNQRVKSLSKMARWMALGLYFGAFCCITFIWISQSLTNAIVDRGRFPIGWEVDLESPGRIFVRQVMPGVAGNTVNSIYTQVTSDFALLDRTSQRSGPFHLYQTSRGNGFWGGNAYPFREFEIRTWVAWVLTLPSLLLPLSRMLRRKNRLPGYCRKCAYDLRATPDRCPECGMVVADANRS